MSFASLNARLVRGIIGHSVQRSFQRHLSYESNSPSLSRQTAVKSAVLGSTKILSEIKYVVFDLANKQFNIQFNEAKGLLRCLSQLEDKTAIVFGNIVVSRSILIDQSIQGRVRHELAVWCCKNPLSLEQFEELLEVDPSSSNEEWRRYLDQFKMKPL